MGLAVLKNGKAFDPSRFRRGKKNLPSALRGAGPLCRNLSAGSLHIRPEFFGADLQLPHHCCGAAACFQIRITRYFETFCSGWNAPSSAVSRPCSVHHWAAFAVSASAVSAKAGSAAGSGLPAFCHSSRASSPRVAGIAVPSGSRSFRMARVASS